MISWHYKTGKEIVFFLGHKNLEVLSSRAVVTFPSSTTPDHLHKSSPNIASENFSRSTFRTSKCNALSSKSSIYWFFFQTFSFLQFNQHLKCSYVSNRIIFYILPLGFLKSKREKRRDKRRKKKNEVIANKEDNISIEAKDNSSTEPSQTEPHVDEEGYIIRATGSDKKSDIDNFYSSSDCDSDENEKKFHFEIKPVLNNGGASVAELRETVKSLSISPSLQQTVS